MLSPDSPNAPNIALITIICTWVFTTIAIIAISCHIWGRVTIIRQFKADDYVLVVAFAITLVLVAQTTWAIVHDSQDKHIANTPRSRLASIFKVSSSIINSFSAHLMTILSHCLRTRFCGV